MLFKYKALDEKGFTKEGMVEAVSNELAISALQRRGLVIVSLSEAKEKVFSVKGFSFFNYVSLKSIVVLSRQIATLFDAQVPVSKIFQMLATNSDNPVIQYKLSIVADDVQSGQAISVAISKHPEIFSDFYVNMIKAGEESGKLSQIFNQLADYLDRYYELNSKTKNAFIYPSFVITTFIVVMILMLTMVVPKLAAIIKDAGQEIPFYTQIILGLSQFLVSYGLFILVGLIGFGLYLWWYVKSESGRDYFDKLKVTIPFIKNLYIKLYLARLTDNIDTMLSSGISAVRALEISATVVGNKVFEVILKQVAEDVKAGVSMSDAFYKHAEIPGILVQMVKVGEETGKLSFVMRTIAKFYKREVDNTVETLVDLIEPIMIVMLGLGVGSLLAAILIPMYSITSGF